MGDLDNDWNVIISLAALSKGAYCFSFKGSEFELTISNSELTISNDFTDCLFMYNIHAQTVEYHLEYYNLANSLNAYIRENIESK